MQELLDQAKQKAEELLKIEPIIYADDLGIPKASGIYLIHFVSPNDEPMVYVGESNDLYRRLIKNHFSGAENGDNSVFRRKLNQKFNLEYGESLREWIIENCLFSWIEISNLDLCHLTEKLVIAHLKNKGEDLLND